MTITKKNFQDVIAERGYNFVVAQIGVARIQQLAAETLAPLIQEFIRREKAEEDSTEIIDFFESREGSILATLAGFRGSDDLIKAAFKAAM